MFNLILKDFLIQKKMFLLSFIYVIFFYIVMQRAGFIILSTALTAVTYMLVITACAYDEKNKADVMLNSLPLKRLHIVLAKYISLFVYLAISTFAYMLTTMFISFTGLPLQAYPVSPAGLTGGLFAISLILGIYLPFYFKFGYIKSKFLSLILFFALYFGLTGSISFFYVNRENAWLDSLNSALLHLTEMQILTMITLLSFILLAVSFLMSLKVYQSRDL